MKISKYFLSLLVCTGLFFSAGAMAEPTGAPVKLTKLRPYLGTNLAFISVNSSALCNTNMFVIDLSAPAAKEAYATALAAFMAEKNVLIEVANATGCEGAFTKIQSISVLGE